MLANLHLKNFRGFGDHRLSFRELTVVVGANNAGKSTIVEALRLISMVATRFRNLRYGPPPTWLGEEGIGIGAKPSLADVGINFENICYHYSDPPACVTAEFAGGSKIQVYLNTEGSCFAVITDQNGHVVRAGGRGRPVDIPSVSIMPQIGPLLPTEEMRSDVYVQRSLSSNVSSLHFRNQLRIFGELLPQLKEAVAETWPGIEINELIVPGVFDKQTIYLQVRNEDFVGEIGSMGHGLQMWLQTIWFLCRAQGSNTIILDEPDVYMHADMQRRLIRFVRGRFPQIIVTTHSVEIMAEVDPENILVVDRRRPVSQYTTSTPAVQSFLERMGSAHNLHLARLWSSRRLILVEGKDLKYMKVLQDKLFPDSHNPIDSIPNMSINGWGGWKYAIGSGMLMQNAIGENILAYCVLDRDYHTEEEIKERHQEALNQGIGLHVWSKKEIENFFLVPTAIQRLISRNIGRRTKAPNLEEVVTEIQTIADGMEVSALDTLSNEYLSTNRGAGVARANEKARARIREARDRTGSIVDIVSGKEVISRLSEWSKTEFGLSFSVVGLVKEVTVEEIPDELRHVLESIEYSRTLGT